MKIIVVTIAVYLICFVVRSVLDFYTNKFDGSEYQFVVYNEIIPILYDFLPLLILLGMHLKSYRTWCKE